MTRESALPNRSAPDTAESVGEVRYVARQAIMDAQSGVHGYCLLFRDDSDTVLRGDCAAATRNLPDDAALFGLDRYTNGLPAFIHCSAEAVVEGLVKVLPSAGATLLLPSTTQPAPQLIQACVEHRASGFRPGAR